MKAISNLDYDREHYLLFITFFESFISQSEYFVFYYNIRNCKSCIKVFPFLIKLSSLINLCHVSIDFH